MLRSFTYHRGAPAVAKQPTALSEGIRIWSTF
jgi:hypothetical protein